MADAPAGLHIETILAMIAKDDAISDLHISAGEYICYRRNGEIVKYDQVGKLTAEAMELFVKQVLHGNPARFEKFQADKDADFAYVSDSGMPYRVNAFHKTGKMWLVMRKINGTAKPLENLMFADIAESVKRNILTKKKGLYLVTGPTGSGKSTSLVAMLEVLNQTRREHMITIEDPIEFIFTPKMSIISQREIGNDSRSFPNAMRAAMREDPDIIFVGEIRDKETAEAALSMAETGHLVFSTLHTGSAAGTVNRYISFFPPEIQDSIADRLSDSLIGVQSQMLVKSKDGTTRFGMYEIMINNTAVRNNIKKKEVAQLDNIIDTSQKDGMIPMIKYAERLIQKNLIDPKEVEWMYKPGMSA